MCRNYIGYDSKRLFTISEYYDRDRTAFYHALQHVREHDMNLTGWLDYFVIGLATQLEEVKERGRLAIQADVLNREYQLNERQAVAIRHLFSEGELTIQQYEELLSDVSRRTLQRDLKGLVDKQIVTMTGAINQAVYRFWAEY